MRQALLLSLFLSACAGVPEVLPAGGRPEVSANVSGITITAFAEPWQGSPYDLGDFLTPIALEFNNASNVPVRVSYFDLILTDEAGHRFAAINPFGGEQPMGLGDEKTGTLDGKLALLDEKPPLSDERSSLLDGKLSLLDGELSLLDEKPVLLAGRGGGSRGGGFRGGGWRGGGVRVGAPRRVGGARIMAPPGFRRGYGYGWGGGFRGYAPYGRYRGWYGTGVNYWGVPWYAPAGYATWVWGWSPTYYPTPQPPSDVLALGLPEGVLQPGGRVAGYVYFQRATDRDGRLALTWDLHDGNTGAPIGRAPLPLEIAR